MAEAATARHVTVRGRVQGVGYRAWVEREAAKHNLDGWVRNRRDGDVEAVFFGPAETVDAMVEACKNGPANASVAKVESREAGMADLAHGVLGFSVLPTV